MSAPRSAIARLLPVLAGGVTVVAIAASAWLWSENRRLRSALTEARRARAAEPAAAPSVEPSDDDPRADAPSDDVAGRRRVRSLFDALARVGDQKADKGKDGDADAPPQDPMERRRRRREWLRAVLGRHDGETADDYKARVAPLVTGALEVPRQRVEAWRDEFEAKAGLSDEQRTAMDGAIGDAQQELVQLANSAVADGSISPYHPSNRGLLEYASQANTVITALDDRLRGALTPEQWAALSNSDFDLLEYIAVTTQWEGLDAPPPAP